MNAELPTATPAIQPPEITFAEIPMSVPSDLVNDPFQADAVSRTDSIAIGISNSISNNLLDRLLEVTHHAR